jgi:GNAT superfamily N-acetyltransferase
VTQSETEIRLAEGEDDGMSAFHLLMDRAREGGIPGTVDPEKLAQHVHEMMNTQGACILLAFRGKKAVGMLSLCESDLFYGPDIVLIDRTFHVLPKYRGDDVGKALLAEAKLLADHTGKALYITITNSKRKRGPRTQWERVGAMLGYQPMGAMIAHVPETTDG